MKEKQKIIVVVGPTTSGKSDLAVKLAKKFSGEVISADSRQVYKGLDIGTGKILKSEMRGIPHYLLDVISPRRAFSAHDFVVRATKAIEDIVRRGKIPIVAGGTGFYIDALVGNTPLPNIPANEKLRAKLEKKTVSQLMTMLKTKNPARAKDIIKKNEQNNKRRLIRAIELSYSKDSYVQGLPLEYKVLWIGIKAEKENLRVKIEKRNKKMLQDGLIAEVKKLHGKGISWKRMEELGFEYKYIADFIRGKITKDEMIEQMNNKTWQYAKRQMTYWRRNKDIRWLSKKEKLKIQKLASSFLAK